MHVFVDPYLKGVPLQRLDDGTRPLTHLSGTSAAKRGQPAAGGHWSEAGAARGTPLIEVAN